MAKMSDEEARNFLTTGTRTARVATVRADGRPHVTPVWFVLDGDTIVFTTGERSVKATDLLRDPRVTLCVDDEMPPYHYVIIEGTAVVTADDPDMLHWATRIGGRYMGEDQAEAFGKRNAVPGEVLVRITLARMLAEKDIAAW